MNFKYYNIAPFFLLAIVFLTRQNDDQKPQQSVPTGIFLDTLNNQIFLELEDGFPKQYFANIFTPVCNTGECLPVKVNIYWDLTGKYLKFDQPDGAILTKRDHVPFTKEDYALLNEILSNENDPRKVYVTKRYKGSPAKEEEVKNEDPFNPAPRAFTFATKYQMVDGVTGSTLPENDGKFVPGALYTTYTLWVLAHDYQAHMLNHTNFNLLIPKNYAYFLGQTDYKIQEEVIALIMGNNPSPTAHADICCSLLDTSSVGIQRNLINHFRAEEYQLEQVQEQLMKTFTETSNEELKKAIISKWISNSISDKNYISLSKILAENQACVGELLVLFSTNFHLTDEIFKNWTDQINQLSAENRQFMMDWLNDNKSLMNHSQKKTLKKLEKQK